MYRIDFGLWSGVFAVPNEIVDHHLKLCGPVALQVLLLLLRSGRPMEAEELAQELGRTLSDIEDALSYWMTAGIILEGTQSVPAPVAAVPTAKKPVELKEEASQVKAPEVIPAPKKERTEPQEPKEEKRKVRVERFARMTRQDVLELSQRDEIVGHLLQETQDVLGRILTNRETESIVGLYYNYDMSPDIILMLLHYCQSIGKDHIAYIERLAVDWVNREINTHERAEQELLRLTSENELRKTIAEIFSITSRGISGKEVEYYQSWTDELKMSRQLIELAHERTMENHGSINFAYTNAILVDWHRKGITSVEQAVREQKPSGGKGKSSTNENNSSASYDMDEVEKMLDYGSVWD